MAATRLPIIRTCYLLVALGASTTWADDSTAQMQPLRMPRRQSPGPRMYGGPPQRVRDRQVAYQEVIESPPAASDSANGSMPAPAADDRYMPSGDTFGQEDLLPIAMSGADGFDEQGLPIDPPAPTQSSGKWFNRGRWYMQEDITYLNRSERKHTNLMTDTSPGYLPPQRDRLRTDRGLGFAPGARITIGRFLGRDLMNRDSSIEFTFLGLNNWTDQRGLVSRSANDLFTDQDTNGTLSPGFQNGNFSQYTYNSRFDSYELNYRLSRRLDRDRMVLTRDGTWTRIATPHLLPTYFGGLRFVALNETFQWRNEGTDPATTLGQYNIRTHNNLIGFQLGSDLTYQQENWRVGARFKSGAFANFADQSTNLHQIGVLGTPVSGPNRIEKATGSALSALAEFNLQGAYLFRPNMMVRAGYDLVLISGLALADKEITFVQTTPALLSVAHGVFIQGVSFGFEFVW